MRLEELALVGGTTLLEASAGTGKTWSIEGLVVRLVVEKKLQISSILVVTFTEAATQELQGRIRQRIQDSITEIERNTIKDPALANSSKYENALECLRRALLEFDEASIFTMHGFCQRLLSEFAFDCGLAFEAQVQIDPAPLLREVTEDYWRRNSQSQAVAIYRCEQGGTPLATLEGILKLALDNPDARILPLENVDATEADLPMAIERFQNQWQLQGEDFTQWLLAEKTLSTAQSSYSASVREALLETCTTCATGTPIAKDLWQLQRLTSAALEKGSKPKQLEKNGAPNHPLLSTIDALVDALQLTCRQFEKNFLAYAVPRMVLLKKERNLFHFQDLLQNVDHALQDDALAAKIRHRYHAALIDEFQDTDPLQWRIFSRLFANTDRFFCLIGDPKQAIYRFRGADIHTYLKAADTAQRKLSLDCNYRSDQALVDQLNTLFAINKEAFLFKAITFTPVRAHHTKERLSDTEKPALALIRMDGQDDLNKSECQRWALEVTADEIVRLLSSDCTVDDRPIGAGDIAVLVRTHFEGHAMQERLHQAGVVSVIQSDASVFDSAQARLLLLLLHALLSPHKRKLARGLGASELIGYQAHELDEFDEALQEQLHELRRLWLEVGFMPMFAQALRKWNVRERFLKMPGGERAITNLLHLGELLHHAAMQESLKAEGLLRWLQTQLQRPDLRTQGGHELRMEGDAQAVQIVTAHKSKGLQYGIVFCPFFYGDTTLRKGAVAYEDGGQVIELRGEAALSDEHRRKALQETLADEIRLLYVALTRARHRSYLLLPNFKSIGGSAFCAMLGVSDIVAMDGALEKAGFCIKKVDTQYSTTAVLKKELQSTGVQLSAKPVHRYLQMEKQVSSYSRLIQDRTAAPDKQVTGNTPEPGSIHAFPKGARIGNFFHHLFETVDYTQTLSIETVERAKNRFGLGEEADAQIALKAVENVLSTPLDVAGKLRLQDIPRRKTCRELEWIMPATLRIKDVVAAFKQSDWQHYASALESLSEQKVNGYMHGYVDLVFEQDGKFYIADWKTNWIGGNADCYTADAIAQEMRHALYFLQAAFYTAAVDAWLAQHKSQYSYENDFGGCFYVFLRGVQRGVAGSGTCFLKPPLQLIHNLMRLQQ